MRENKCRQYDIIDKPGTAENNYRKTQTMLFSMLVKGSFCRIVIARANVCFITFYLLMFALCIICFFWKWKLEVLVLKWLHLTSCIIDYFPGLSLINAFHMFWTFAPAMIFSRKCSSKQLFINSPFSLLSTV